ncbi:MAG TPA: hypothetical protein VKQ28_12110 [Candidatus Acidoferrum sp.]|nr:hypothetical protein [Candidatus Acidoferrum sp.]
MSIVNILPALRNRRRSSAANSERGFALMMVMFMTTILLLSAIAAAPYIRTERQREREDVMIWRGKQYVRAIKLYYLKTGRFPTSVDDLTKAKLGSLRFMRQAYKDPMNKEDGSWRFIYVGPAGQLIGSLKPPQTMQIPGLGAPAGANPQQTAAPGSSGTAQSSPPQTGSQPAATQNGTNPTPPGQGAPASASAADDAANAAANAAPSGLINSDSPVLGGNIIGVGSKVNRRSIIVYDKAKNYRLFEFVWNPSKDMANAMNQQIAAPNPNPQGTAPGRTGFGQSSLGQQNNQQNNQQNQPGNPPPDMPLPSPPPDPNPPQ